MAGKQSRLTPEQKRANIAAGLTPTGRVKRGAKPGQVTKAPDKYKDGDYRCLGTAFTPHRKNKYLAVLRETGEKVLARAEVGVSRWTVTKHRTDDRQFRDAEDEALLQHAAIYAQEAKRRGLEGVQEPVYGSQGQGMGVGILGWVTKYSDRLLIEQLRRHNKEYTPKTQVESKVEHSGGVASLDLDQLSPESQEDLLRILEREGVGGGGDDGADDPE